MKTKIFILLLILSAVVLTASTAPPTQVVSGTLQWTRASICGYQDYIPTSTGKIFLTGNGFPTDGENVGCHIRAEGYFMKTGMEYCRVFYVRTQTLSCSLTTMSR